MLNVELSLDRGSKGVYKKRSRIYTTNIRERLRASALFLFKKNIIERNYIMPKLFKELEMLCDADKRKSTNELPFVSAHMLHDLYLRWTAKHNK